MRRQRGWVGKSGWGGRDCGWVPGRSDRIVGRRNGIVGRRNRIVGRRGWVAGGRAGQTRCGDVVFEHARLDGLKLYQERFCIHLSRHTVANKTSGTICKKIEREIRGLLTHGNIKWHFGRTFNSHRVELDSFVWSAPNRETETPRRWCFCSSKTVTAWTIGERPPCCDVT